MSVLANYEPKSVFSYFEKLCTIPRGSGNTDGIASYLISFAKEHGLESYRDAANNVIIRKPAMVNVLPEPVQGTKTLIRLFCRAITIWSARRTKAWTSTSSPTVSRFMWTAMTSEPRVQHWAAITVLLWQ